MTPSRSLFNPCARGHRRPLLQAQRRECRRKRSNSRSATGNREEGRKLRKLGSAKENSIGNICKKFRKKNLLDFLSTCPAAVSWFQSRSDKFERYKNHRQVSAPTHWRRFPRKSQQLPVSSRADRRRACGGHCWSSWERVGAASSKSPWRWNATGLDFRSNRTGTCRDISTALFLLSARSCLWTPARES